MAKKSLIMISIFFIIAIISSSVFASNMMNDAGNTLSNIKDGVQNMVNDAGRYMGDAVNGVTDMANDAANSVRDMGNDVGNGANDVAGQVSGSNDSYTATRTSATDTTGNTLSDAMVWIVLGVAGVAIVALVWYYGTQTSNRENY